MRTNWTYSELMQLRPARLLETLIDLINEEAEANRQE